MSEILTRRVYEIPEIRKKPHYDWMHPSWRDLVIDHLASSAKARIEFLRRCGRHGIQLALSRGGGAQGKRQKPLLVTIEDWQTLQENIKTRVSNEAAEAVHAILSSVQEAILYGASSHVEANDHSNESLRAIAQDAISILRLRWDRESTVIPLEMLVTYCQITELLDPLPPMPRLIPTWEAYWAAALDELTFDPSEKALSTYSIGKWIDLLECISGSEPRMMKQVSFPDCAIEGVTRFFETATGYIEGDADLQTRGDYESEIEILSELKIVNRLANSIPSFGEPAAKLSEDINLKRSRLQDELGELFPEPDYEGDDSRPSGGISIEEILSDL